MQNNFIQDYIFFSVIHLEIILHLHLIKLKVDSNDLLIKSN